VAVELTRFVLARLTDSPRTRVHSLLALQACPRDYRLPIAYKMHSTINPSPTKPNFHLAVELWHIQVYMASCDSMPWLTMVITDSSDNDEFLSNVKPGESHQ
jgi:hypothetical protein